MKEQLRGTKTRFVMEYRAHKPVDEVIAAGKRAGITLNPSNVYQVRVRARRALSDPARIGPDDAMPTTSPPAVTLGTGVGKTATAIVRPPRAARIEVRDAGSDREFDDLCIELGLVRSTELLAQTRAYVADMIGR